MGLFFSLWCFLCDWDLKLSPICKNAECSISGWLVSHLTVWYFGSQRPHWTGSYNAFIVGWLAGSRTAQLFLLLQASWLDSLVSRPSPTRKKFREWEMTSPSSATFHCGGGRGATSGREVQKSKLQSNRHTCTRIHGYVYAHTGEERLSAQCRHKQCLFIKCSSLLMHLSFPLALHASLLSVSSSVTPPPRLWLKECKKHIWNLLETRKGGKMNWGDGKREKGKMSGLSKWGREQEWKADNGARTRLLFLNSFWKMQKSRRGDGKRHENVIEGKAKGRQRLMEEGTVVCMKVGLACPKSSNRFPWLKKNMSEKRGEGVQRFSLKPSLWTFLPLTFIAKEKQRERGKTIPPCESSQAWVIMPFSNGLKDSPPLPHMLPHSLFSFPTPATPKKPPHLCQIDPST